MDTEGPCAEPGGNARPGFDDGDSTTHHELSLQEMGHCPWCGDEE
jgi:hypothetical protein